MRHNNIKTDSVRKKKERIERARASRRAFWFKKKTKEGKDAVKKS